MTCSTIDKQHASEGSFHSHPPTPDPTRFHSLLVPSPVMIVVVAVGGVGGGEGVEGNMSVPQFLLLADPTVRTVLVLIRHHHHHHYHHHHHELSTKHHRTVSHRPLPHL